MSKQQQSIGLVLSGGGIRGMAHIGLIRALEEQGLEAAMVSGTSVGAVVGALYCNGKTVEEMLEFFRETPLFKYNYLTWHKPGLVDTDRYIDLFETEIGARHFEALKKPLYVMTTNLEKGEAEVFHTGELIRPVLASAALPPYFSPVLINGQLYTDGGIMNNFPIEPLKNKATIILGSNVSMVRKALHNEMRTMIQLAQRTTSLMMHAMNKPKLESCDLLFEPKKLADISVLDKKRLESAYQIGYDHARETLSKWKIPV